MLTWPQNARNPISKDLNFKNFLWYDAAGPPLRGPALAVRVSNPLFENTVSAPTLDMLFQSFISAVSKYFFVVVSLSSLSRGSTVYQYIILNNHMFHVQVFYHNSQINQRFFVKK